MEDTWENTWVIGDVQGCNAELGELLDRISEYELRENDTVFKLPSRIIFCGDLVNRGPDSVGVIQRIRAMQASGRDVQTVLGNHDLFALACHAGIQTPKPDDTLDDLLAQNDGWVNWLRHQPLAIHLPSQTNASKAQTNQKQTNQTPTDCLITHAGVWPEWDLQTSLNYSRAVESLLRSDDWAAQLAHLWDGKARFAPLQSGQNAKLENSSSQYIDTNALRFVINAFMRMRYIAPDGGLDFAMKESMSSVPSDYTPWYAMTAALPTTTVRVFGHWSALGWMNTPTHLALDTGCVWGGSLTACRLAAKPEDRVRISVSSYLASSKQGA